MKSAVKKAVSLMMRNDRLWSLVDATLLRAARAAEWERGRSERDARRDRMDAAVSAISPDLRVRHGIFEGMTYAERAAAGSQLAPKLLGSYEAELRGIIERVCSTGYSDIVDVGCAEGYYAVGLALRMPNAKVYAYDVDEEAIRLCRRMADVNGVSSQVVTGAFCDARTLMSIPFTGKALIVSDCEGYEKQLFTPESVAFLAPHDVLVEVHDFVDIEISSYLRSVFAATHDIEVIQSIDDIKKAQDYSYPELEGLDLAMRREVLAERRPTAMEWFFMTSRAGAVA
jgi:hypothetical protein